MQGATPRSHTRTPPRGRQDQGRSNTVAVCAGRGRGSSRPASAWQHHPTAQPREVLYSDREGDTTPGRAESPAQPSPGRPSPARRRSTTPHRPTTGATPSRHVSRAPAEPPTQQQRVDGLHAVQSAAHAVAAAAAQHSGTPKVIGWGRGRPGLGGESAGGQTPPLDAALALLASRVIVLLQRERALLAFQSAGRQAGTEGPPAVHEARPGPPQQLSEPASDERNPDCTPDMYQTRDLPARPQRAQPAGTGMQLEHWGDWADSKDLGGLLRRVSPDCPPPAESEPPVAGPCCTARHPLLPDPKADHWCNRCAALGWDTIGTTHRCAICDFDVCADCYRNRAAKLRPSRGARPLGGLVALAAAINGRKLPDLKPFALANCPANPQGKPACLTPRRARAACLSRNGHSGLCKVQAAWRGAAARKGWRLRLQVATELLRTEQQFAANTSRITEELLRPLVRTLDPTHPAAAVCRRLLGRVEALGHHHTVEIGQPLAAAIKLDSAAARTGQTAQGRTVGLHCGAKIVIGPALAVLSGGAGPLGRAPGAADCPRMGPVGAPADVEPLCIEYDNAGRDPVVGGASPGTQTQHTRLGVLYELVC